MILLTRSGYYYIHAEACRHLDRTVEAIREKGVLAGVALNPATPLETVRYILPKVDMLLIMTVNPGFGGQKLIPYTLDKVREAKNLVKQSGCKTDIEVDGELIWKMWKKPWMQEPT